MICRTNNAQIFQYAYTYNKCLIVYQQWQIQSIILLALVFMFSGNPQFGQGQLSVSIPHLGQIIFPSPFLCYRCKKAQKDLHSTHSHRAGPFNFICYVFSSSHCPPSIKKVNQLLYPIILQIYHMKAYILRTVVRPARFRQILSYSIIRLSLQMPPLFR